MGDDRERPGSATEGWSWEAVATEWIDGLPDGGLNIAHEAVDRHVAAGDGDREALRAWDENDQRRTWTYAELAERAARFAGLLKALGVGRGERVFSLLPQCGELFIACLGTLKAGAVYSPLFTVFGPDPIRNRLERGEGRVLVTTRRLYQRKIAGLREGLPRLAHVLIVDEAGDSAEALGWDAVSGAAPAGTAATDRDSPALLLFTSGTTGTPKGVLHSHGVILPQHATARTVLGLRSGDVYWCTADPGWVTGIVYGVLAPLSCAATVVADPRPIDPMRWLATLVGERVAVWYTAPTALRMLRRAEVPTDAYDLSALRLIASTGEPLDTASARWVAETFGRPPHDTWWQSETGAIVVAHSAEDEPRPGELGYPVPGARVAVLRRTEEGPPTAVAPGETGEIAIADDWPGLFRGYLAAPEQTQEALIDGWYLSGDLAVEDPASGALRFIARSDDVIKTAGHLVGPVEVEEVLNRHPNVQESVVYGVDDPVAGKVVVARVIPAEAGTRSETLRQELIAHARRQLGPAIAPREITFVDALERTPSGKLIRRPPAA